MVSGTEPYLVGFSWGLVIRCDGWSGSDFTDKHILR